MNGEKRADHSSAVQHRRNLRFLVKSAASLSATTVVTSGLGFAYWVFAARLFPAADVGASATAIAAMNLIAPFVIVGLGTALISRLPTMTGSRAEMVSTAALFCGAVGAVVALILAVALPSDFLGLPGIGQHAGPTLLFAGGVAAQGIGLMLDSALLSVAGGGTQFWRNTIFAITKLMVLIAIALGASHLGSLGIYASWFAANVIAIATVAAWLLLKYRVPVRRLMPAPALLRGLPHHAAGHHALNLALQVPFFAMPIIANATLGSEQAGYLYATWSVAGLAFVLPMALATALFAAGARDSSTILKEFRRTLRWSLAAATAANLVILPLGAVLLGVFGEAYADNGRTALTVLCIGALGAVIKDHHVALARISGQVGREAVLISGLGVLEIIGAVVGAGRGGITGLTLGWLAVVALRTAICGPRVWRAYRGKLVIPTATVTGIR